MLTPFFFRFGRLGGSRPGPRRVSCMNERSRYVELVQRVQERASDRADCRHGYNPSMYLVVRGRILGRELLFWCVCVVLPSRRWSQV